MEGLFFFVKLPLNLEMLSVLKVSDYNVIIIHNVFEGENNLPAYLCFHRRHRCPHETTRIYENSGVYCPTTEYSEKYPAYGNVPPAQSLKPKQGLQAYRGKMEGMTTFK